MPIEHDAIVFGVAGPFGSGCSELCRVLARDYDFEVFALSDKVKEVAAACGVDTKVRGNLQDVGNDLRKTEGHSFLADVAIGKASGSEKRLERVAFDGIRHCAELRAVKKVSGRAFVVSVTADRDVRYGRPEVCKYYVDEGAQGRLRFDLEEERDQDEGLPWGQQVAPCVRFSDITLSNNNNEPGGTSGEVQAKVRTLLRDKIGRYVRFLTGEVPATPEPGEKLMATALLEAGRSCCLKRRVGAVIALPGKDAVISCGYNENPTLFGPCIKHFRACRKEILAEEFRKPLREALVDAGRLCPQCHTTVGTKDEQGEWRCKKCRRNLDKHFFGDKMLDLCPALHAEEMAIIKARGDEIRGATLYTTTFPCLQCAKKIAEVGISAVYFFEPYPTVDEPLVKELFEGCGVKLHRFEGVTGHGYPSFFVSQP